MPEVENSAILCPLTNSRTAYLESTLECSAITETYLKCFGLDTSTYFKDTEHLNIYRCNETGYRFYYPFIQGDENFYQQLQDYPWYYAKDKWEFDIAERFIDSNMSVLEVGCGRGNFLDKVAKRGAACVGLELNQDAVRVGKRKGLTVTTETIQSHAISNPGKYDLVCTFQVLEHISDVDSFVGALVKSLKLGGTLIISVPNCDSFIKDDKKFVLNMPPHHIGMWNNQSLENLADHFGLEFDHAFFEPLSNNCEWYYSLQTRRLLHYIQQFPFMVKVVRRILKIVSSPAVSIINIFSRKKHGHSILVTYTKK